MQCSTYAPMSTQSFSLSFQTFSTLPYPTLSYPTLPCPVLPYPALLLILFQAKASMIWIIGEYAERIDNADELLESFLGASYNINNWFTTCTYCTAEC
jgi:hypothetical protein